MSEYKSPFNKSDHVTSIELEVVNFEPHKTLRDWMFWTAGRYSVELTTSTLFPHNSVKVSGYYHSVSKLIADQWGSNETVGTLPLYVDMCLGDRLAEYLWNNQPAPEKPHEKFNWAVHWEACGYGTWYGSSIVTADQNTEVTIALEASVETLIASGYSTPFSGDSPSDFAQTYLQLAFLHCPDLMNHLRAKQPSYDGIMLDGFNLFVGAAFQFLEETPVWVVMDFKDGGEGANTVAEEKVLVRVRRADDGENDVVVRDAVLDYNDKVVLVGSVRNAQDLDDNNWGNS